MLGAAFTLMAVLGALSMVSMFVSLVSLGFDNVSLSDRSMLLAGIFLAAMLTVLLVTLAVTQPWNGVVSWQLW